MLRCGLTLVLAACATSSSGPAPSVAGGPRVDEPVSAEPEPAPTSSEEPSMAPLKLSMQRSMTLRSGVTLRYENLAIEQIAAGPSSSYPAGSGITLTLVVEGLGGAPIRRPISLLSAGYVSRQVAWFGPYRVVVADVVDPHRREATVLLHVSETTDVAASVPVVVTLARQGSVALGDATMVLVGLTREGRTVDAPLLLTSEYRVPGSESETQRDSVAGIGQSWGWRDHRFTLREFEDGGAVTIEVVRVRMAPLRR